MDCMVQSPLGNWYPSQEYRECEAIPSNLHWEILTRLLKPAEYCVLMVEDSDQVCNRLSTIEIILNIRYRILQ